MVTDSEEQKNRFRDYPDEYEEYCKQLETEISLAFKMILVGTPEAETAKTV